VASFTRKFFNLHTQYKYSTRYWSQTNKLGPLFATIDWKLCGNIQKQLPLAQRFWLAKWFTNWLPLGQNMQCWNMWDSNLCPICKDAPKDAWHFLSCPNPQQSAYLVEHILKIDEQLTAQHIPLPVAQMMMHAIFPDCPAPAGLYRLPPALLSHQLKLNTQKWGLLSIQWHSQLEPFTLDPTQMHHTLHWLSSFLQQLWNTAWDLWQYQNGILHQQHCIGQHAKLQLEVKLEFEKGMAFLPRADHHWVQVPLQQLLNKHSPFLESWLATVQTIRKREQNRFHTITLTR